MKKQFKLKDKTGAIVFIELEVTTRNGYPELTICGERSGHHGQITVDPATELQKKLVKLWNTKHLKKVNKKEQKEIANLVEELEHEYEEQRGEMEVSKMDESEILDMILERSFGDPEKVLALLIEEGATAGEIDDVTEEGGNRFSFGGREYLICTDEQADEEHDQDLENYLDECVLPDLPKNAQRYFDREAWKSDARMDGRGHSLGRYDGNENEQKVNGTTYFLYRQ